MKKIILFLLATLTLSSTNAQFEKGDKLLETSIGNFKFGKTKSPNNGNISTSKYLSITVEASAFYFLTPKIAIGASLISTNIAHKANNTNGKKIIEYESSSSIWTLQLSPIFRYYFHSNEKSRFYGQLAIYSIFYPINKFTSTANDPFTGDLLSTHSGEVTESHHFTLIPSLGWNYFISPQVALHMNLGYSFKNSKSTEDYVEQTNIGPPFTAQYIINEKRSEIEYKIGFAYLLPSKKK